MYKKNTKKKLFAGILKANTDDHDIKGFGTLKYHVQILNRFGILQQNIIEAFATKQIQLLFYVLQLGNRVR